MVHRKFGQITVRFRVIEVEPDGSTCYCCGGVCYLKRFQLGVDAKEFGKHLLPLFSFCDSCVDAVREIVSKND